MANQAVYGIIDNRIKAEQIIQSLIDLGVRPQDISLLSGQQGDFKDISADYVNQTNRNWREEQRLSSDTYAADDLYNKDQTTHRAGLDTQANTKAPEGAATGVTTGGIIGGVLGLLAGMGALAIPGMGPFIAAGPIMGALSGLGLGGAVGGILGALIGLGIPEYEAKLYENYLKNGGALLAVHATSDEWATKIKNCFEKFGAKNISVSSAEAYCKNCK